MWVRSAVLFVLMACVAGCTTPNARQRLAADRRDAGRCIARGWLAPPALPAYQRHGHVIRAEGTLADQPAYGYKVPPRHPDLEQIIIRCP